jgi:hypothetical protein
MALIADFLCKMAALETYTSDSTVGTTPISTTIDGSASYGSGTASGLVDLQWSDLQTIAGGGSNVHDLVGGGLTNPFGTACAYAKVRGFALKNLSTANVLTVRGTLWIDAGGATAPWTNNASPITVRAGGMLMIVAPDAYTVAAGADTFTVTGTAGQTYLIGVIGTSA